jgi:predicted ABC-class ATPase
MDDHAAGDGREFLVTVRGVRGAEATGCELAGADISMFFASLPPGVNGPVHAVSGQGSGSMGMACQVQEAVRKGAPVLVIDEDRAAPNLLVRSCIQSAEITPLSEIIARQRALLGDTALVLAACAMDTLVAEADRIMLLEQHEARAVDPAAFRTMVRESLLRTAEQIRRRSDST